MSMLPDFKVGVSKSSKLVTMTYKDQTTDFILYDGKINGWELDDFLTKCIKQLTDTQELRKSLSGQ